jgi:trehalose/maltose hydrolase-like predicted phosphorylase
MSSPIEPPIVTEPRAGDLPAYVSNGLVGMRVMDVALLPGVALVNGFSGLHPEVEVQSAAPAPFPIAGDLAIDGVWLVTSPQQARFLDQRYDFATGELTGRFAFRNDGVTATVETTVICSRAQPTLVLTETVVEVDRPCELVCRALVQTSNLPGRMSARHTSAPGTPEIEIDGSLEWTSLGGEGRVGMAYVTEFDGAEDVRREVQSWGRERPLATDYTLRAVPGRRYRLRRFVSIVPNVLHSAPERMAVRLVTHAASRGFERAREENRTVWSELWRGRILIDADDGRWQALADAAFFYLNASIHPSSPSSTSIYGLAQWNDYHYYYGHVMWDIDLFCVPPLLLVQPEAARAMLEFRTQTMKAARSHAKLLGRRGIQFPWESGPADGEEATRGAGQAAWFEDHVSLAVAWAVAQYGHVTGDERFMLAGGNELLYGVADWIDSRVDRATDGSVAWRESMGVAETSRPVDDDAYTVMAANTVLREALGAAERSGAPRARSWEDLSQRLCPEPSPSTGAILTHDGYHPRERKGSTPSPLAGIFPLWFPMERDVEQATLRYYLRQADGYIGSPMLSALYGVWACWAGERGLAARLFDEGYAKLVGGRFLQTLEMSPTRFPDRPRSGPFFANLGGFLMGLLYGLPALRTGPGAPDGWPARRVVLPEGWRSVQVERAWVRGRPMRLIAEQGDARARLIEGE